MIDLSTDELALSLQQPAQVVELDTETGDEKEKIPEIMVIAYAGRDETNSFGQNFIVQDGSWTVIPIVPNETLEEGDVFILKDEIKLKATQVNHVDSDVLGNVMWISCQRI